MAASRRAAQQRREEKEERRWKRWIERERWKRTARELAKIENIVIGKPTVEWEMLDGPNREGEFDLLGVDQSLGPGDTVLITGTKGKDGTYRIKATGPGSYLVAAKINQ